MMDYWRECISEAFEESKIEATPEQIDNVTAWVEGAHENYGMAMGYDVASANLAADRRREVEALKEEVRREQEKIACKICNGSGWITTPGPYHSCTSRCWKCDGVGRHDL